MKKLYSELIGKPVMARDSSSPVARVFDLILDPANGTFVALSVYPRMRRVVGARDVLSWIPEIMIRDTESMVVPDDIVRIKHVMDHYAPFYGNRVETESGKSLGTVYDYLFDLNAGVLLTILVAKSFLGVVHYDDRIITAGDIIKVEPERIIVKDDLAGIPVVPTEQVLAGA